MAGHRGTDDRRQGSPCVVNAEREIVKVNNVVKDFRPGFGIRKKRVLHGISFGVMPGEIFGFVGPNGAGKTTTLKVLMGLIRPTSGGATILGRDVRETAFRREIGFLPEHAYFYDYLTGRELLDFYARLSGVDASERATRVATLLDWVGLTESADLRVRAYSKGMAQRVGIAQALVHDPSVVFLDEPMSGLDPIGRKEIRDLVIRLRSEGKTVFMNTHILSDVEMVCDRVAIIVGGKIMYQGRTDEFLYDGECLCDIVVSGITPELTNLLEEEHGVELRGVGAHVELRVKEKAVEAVLYAVLQARGRVQAVTPHRLSLETAFLEAVQEEGS